MQSPPASTRGSIQRGSPTSSSAHNSSSIQGSSSSASTRNPAQRRQVNLSTIEKSVTHLLIATKQLLETLTAWSRGTATEAQVSDVYVRLGSEFNIACRAFTAIGVETSDLGNVPDALRTILESTLSQDASPASLDGYLPRIREIIINLLHGLKRKQSRLRQRQAKENGESIGSGGSGPQRASTPARTQSTENLEEQIAPPRTSSLPAPAKSSLSGPPYPTGSNGRGSSGSQIQHSTSPSIITTSPVSPPPSDMTAFQAALPPQYFVPPPPPEPKEDPLIALQRESALERRASRRYSAYQIAKLTGASPNGVPMLPTHPSPTPRHREPQDGIDAGRVRQAGRRAPRTDTSPMKKNRISEEREDDPGLKSPEAPDPKLLEEGALVSPPPPPKETDLRRQPSLKVTTVPAPAPPQLVEPSIDLQPQTEESRSKTPIPQDVPDTSDTVRPGSATSQSSLTKEMTIFLQIGRSIKKTVLPDGVDDLSLTSLRLLFISKFNYNPPAGEDFPDIYLQDPTSGVRYELEDLQDVKDRSVLCLNVEVLDEVKRHISEGIGGLRKLVEGVKGLVDGQAVALQRVAERQEEAAKKIAELSVTPTASPPPPTTSTSSPANAPETTSIDRNDQIKEIRDLRRDLAVLRQVYSSFVSDVNNSMTTIKAKAATVKTTAENASTIAAIKATPGSGRAYVEEGKKTLGTDADNLVTRVDDLQDLVEELRKDVVQRGVRPLNRQLETVSKDLIQAKQELKRMSEYIKREKPKWKKVWEKELEVVCDDQQFFNMQEELVSDLQDDLEKASQTFALVEQCTEQQVKTSGRGTSGGFRPTIDETIDVASVKGNVLNEVRALRPNHENRLEAIERAERLRQKELEGRVPEFKKELGKFVEEGKLKKAGGVEEAERLRKARDEQILKETWEGKKNGILRTTEGGVVEEEEKKEEPTVTPPLTATDGAPGADAPPNVADLDAVVEDTVVNVDVASPA